MCREVLKKCGKGHYVFTGVPVGRVFDRECIKNVTIMKTDGSIIGEVEHMLTNIKPFKPELWHELCRFTGTVYSYRRFDGTVDYSVTVNKAMKIA